MGFIDMFCSQKTLNWLGNLKAIGIEAPNYVNMCGCEADCAQNQMRTSCKLKFAYGSIPNLESYQVDLSQTNLLDQL